MKRSGRDSKSPTLDNPLFVSWLMGDTPRIEMLSQGFDALAGTPCNNIVLTNGFAQNATRVLQNIGLAKHFKAVCDTRGAVVRNPASPDADVVEIEDGSRYSKEQFVEDYIFNEEASSELFGLAVVDHAVYVDDDPEGGLHNRPEVDVLGLPKEGRSLEHGDFAQVTAFVDGAAKAGRKSVLCVFDFDCTITRMHMFKAMHQDSSKWRKGWNSWLEQRAKKLRAEGAEGEEVPDSPPVATAAAQHIEEKPPGLQSPDPVS